MSTPWYVTALAWFSLVDCMLLLLAIGILLGRKLAPNFRRVRQLQALRRRVRDLERRVDMLDPERSYYRSEVLGPLPSGRALTADEIKMLRADMARGKSQTDTEQ